jgi:hypothetical protein
MGISGKDAFEARTGLRAACCKMVRPRLRFPAEEFANRIAKPFLLVDGAHVPAVRFRPSALRAC